MRSILLPLGILLAGCAAEWRGDYDRLTADVAYSSRFTGPIARIDAPGTDAELDRMLSSPLDLDLLVKVAIDRNPELKESLARAKAGLEEVRRASSLDDPMLKYESWGIPINQPTAFNRDQTNMFGLRQTFPFPGNLSLRGEAALRDAESIYQMFRDKQLDVVVRLKKAYYVYSSMSKEIEIHLEHVKILGDFEKISDIKFRNGTVSQQDVLKPQVELIMLHNDVLAMNQHVESAKAAINSLLNRPPEAPLGTPRELSVPQEEFDAQDLAAKALSSRPDLLAAQLKAKSSEAALSVAHREATLPDFSVGADYWQLPGAPNDAYGVMFSINLPWFTGKHRAEVAKLEHVLRADQAAVDTARNRALFEVRDAYLKVEAVRKSVILYKGELLPKSAQSVEVSRASYEKDKASFLDLLDAERSLRDIKLKFYQAVAEYQAAVADLERAVGTTFRRTP
jgi:cobalt-zinc-cadmium efflux system outer membrane protein